MSTLYKETPEHAASLIQTAIKHNVDQGINTLHELLDNILNTKRFESWKNVVPWLKALVTDGSSWDNFAKKVRDKDDSPFCGCVWTSDFVAYRCRTCATSPCMSLCAACFERGNHEGHDYNMFRSEAGGACDCGDPHVMLVSGFCSHHGPDRIKPQQLPNNFIASAKVVIERMIIAVFQILRYLSSQGLSYESAWEVTITPEVKDMLTFLHELVKLGSPIINIVSEFLLSETAYSNLQTCQGYSFLKDESSELYLFHRQTVHSLSKSIASMKDPQIPLGINPKIEFGDSRKYTRLIDELTFWIVRFDFCEPLILFVLNLLPNAEMKREFARAFIRHYARIACTLNESANSDPLTNRLAERVVHVSVQLFSNEEIALHLAQEEHLIEIFLISLYNVLHIYMDDSKTNPMDRHKYVSMTRGPRGRSHAYWPIASDFGNFLGHTSVALFFLSHEELLKPWVKLMIPFCGMELNHRAMERHIEYEPSNMLNHYYMVRETCASPLLCLLDVLHEPATVHYTKQLVRIFMEALNKFFDAIAFTGDLSHDQISFHYPLHRYISCLISNALKYQGARLEDFDISTTDAKKLIAHPLQIMTSMTEISNNMWVRNGLYIQTQALAYKQHLFSRFHIDADIFLIQMCVSILPAEYFVVTILNRFRIFATLALSDSAYQRLSKNLDRGHPDADKQPMMVEGALRLLINVLSNHHCLDISDEELMRREVVSLIACRPRTFSVLSDNISHCHDANQGMNRGLGGDILRKVVNEVAIKREARDAMEQTTYIMKPASWELYDPIFIDQRILYKRDVQEAFKNYHTNLLDTGTMEKSSVSITQAWPPYKDIRPVKSKYGDMLKVLRCDNLHSVIFLILQKFSTQHPFISETTLSLAIHLLSSALKVSESLPNTVDDTFKDIRLFNFWKSSNIWNKLTEDVVYEGSKTANPFSHVLRRRNHSAESESGSSAAYPPSTTDGGDSVELDSELPRCSFLMLLIKIYNTHTKSYFELPDDVFLARDLKPPSLKNSIINLLHYTASHSATIHNEICHISSSLKPQPTGDRNSQPTSNPQNEQAQLRRLRAKEAREAMMRKLQEDSKNFLKKSQQMSGQANDAEEADTDGDNKVERSPSYSCVICLEGHLPETKAETSSTAVLPSHTHEGSSVEESVASSSVVTVMEMDYGGGVSDDQEQMDTTSIIYDMNHITQKTSNNDFGLICFIQETTVLGRRRQVDERFSYESSGELRSCKDSANEWADLLKTASCNYSMEEMTNLAHTRGIHVSTCGHYVHQKCHDDYLHSIEQNDRLMYEESMLHGFTCPICRQMSNFILPVDVDTKLEDAWGVDTALLVMKIYKALYDNVPTYPEDMEQFFHSILRFNLHQFLMQLADENSKHPNRDNMSNLVKAIPASSSTRLFDKRLLKRKIPIKDIFHMYYAVARYQRECENVEIDESLARLRARLLVPSDPHTPVGPLPTFGSAVRSSDDIPVIFADPFSVLLQILPDVDIALGNFHFIFHLVFRLAYVKALVFVLRRFSDEERSAWTNPSITGNKCHDELRRLVHSLLTKLPNDFFKDDEQFPSSCGSDMFETQTVFSPLSVMSMVEDEMNEFLQLGALLQHHVFESTDADDPSTSTAPSPFDSHVEVYVKFLGLYNGDSTEFYLHQCFDIAKMDLLIKRWYNETKQCNSLSPSGTRQMAAFGLSRNWKLPKIISMPRKYNTFFQHYRKQTCMYCKHTPVQPTVCLVCGAMVCYKVDCMNGQHPDGGFTTTRHARDCGAGTSIFVIVNSAYVFVMRPRRVCIWGTLYLDENGEEDVGWKRGKPIFLKEQRLELLEKQWRRNLFDHVCKGWSAHNNAF